MACRVGRPGRAGPGVAPGIPKGILPRLSRREFQLRAPLPTLRAQIKRRDIVEIVILGQIILTVALIVGFSVDVLLSSIAAAK